MLLRRNTLITWFVVCWTLVFQYETLRLNYLSPLLSPSLMLLTGHPLPKLPLLFPPAGWIMFFNVDKSYGFAEVYGFRKGEAIRLDPHDIFETRAVGYDNIHRNMLVGILERYDAPAFCRYLVRKFPPYEAFAAVYAQYPDVAGAPDQVLRQVAYRCTK